MQNRSIFKQFLKTSSFIILLGVFSILLLIPFSQEIKSQAVPACDPAIANIIARDSAGKFIGKIKYGIYEQLSDVDGNPKPGASVGSGETSDILGKGVSSVSVKDGSKYALKLWDNESSGTAGEFWFYDTLNLSCGVEVDVNIVLSNINIVLRDTDNNLLKNKNFSIYTQRQDVDGKPIKEKDDFVANYNTSEEGEVNVYVGDSKRSMVGKNRDYYIFEIKNENGGIYTIYDLAIADGKTTELKYTLSDMALTIKDSKGVLFPANTNIEIFQQKKDNDGEKIIGNKIKDIKTNDKGFAIFQYPAGIYAGRILDADKQYQYFWDLEIRDKQRNSINLTVGEKAGAGACEANSGLTLITKNSAGEPVPAINFEIYEQTLDVNKKPMSGVKAASGKVGEEGRGTVYFNPDPRKTYILKLYQNNSTVGDFWFFDNIKFYCNENKEIQKTLSSIKIILRDGGGELKKNQPFEIYTQKFDADNKPVKEKKELAGKFNTGEAGATVIYLASDHPYIKNKRGKYIFASSGGGKGGAVYTEYNIDVASGQETVLEYIFSDVIFDLKNAAEEALGGKDLEIFNQDKDVRGNKILGKSVAKIKTDKNGTVRFEYPAGIYAASMKDSAGGSIIFWGIEIKSRARINQELTTNLVRLNLRGSAGNILPEGTAVNVYSMISDSGGVNYYKNKKITTTKIGASGYANLILKSDYYLFTFSEEKFEYGKFIYINEGELENITIEATPDSQITADKKFKGDKLNLSLQSLSDRLNGYILLQVEGKGEAWYVDGKTSQRYYMKDGKIAYDMMRKFGLGIKSSELEKIEVGLDNRFKDNDTDGDGLPDKMEEALKTDSYDSDSDDDGYSDGDEVRGGFNPMGSGKIIIDKKAEEKLKGKILLQVESRGEAWYINPKDGKRYYMKDGENAYQIMRFLSLGIKNNDLTKIKEGKMQ